MGLFTWKDDYAVGVPEIDVQHRKLFEMAEALHGAMSEGAGREALAKVWAT